jgi:hypothetical protein
MSRTSRVVGSRPLLQKRFPECHGITLYQALVRKPARKLIQTRHEIWAEFLTKRIATANRESCHTTTLLNTPVNNPPAPEEIEVIDG